MFVKSKKNLLLILLLLLSSYLTSSKFATISVFASSFPCEAVISQKKDFFVLSTCLISKTQNGKSVEFVGESQAFPDGIFYGR